MNLGEFKEQMKGNIRRGNSLDDLIPGFIRKGALWIERNNTLQYMRKFATISVDPAGDSPRYITLEDTRIKSVEMFRWGLAERYQDLVLLNPKDVPWLETTIPRGYWLDGVDRLVLSATPSEVLTGELAVVRYTAWPTSDTATHWLMDNAEDVLEARAMINFAKHARDADAAAWWTKVFDDGLIGLYAADQELQWSNSDLRLEYNGQ